MGKRQPDDSRATRLGRARGSTVEAVVRAVVVRRESGRLGVLAADGVRAIGVSNFLQEHLDTLLAETTTVPAVNQFELHPTFQQAALSAKTRAHGIAVEAYSPLGRGTDLNAEAVTTLAQTHGATPAQIVLGWHLGVGNIVIPKSVNAHRLRENLAASEVTLSQDELDAITALESGVPIAPDPAEAAFTQMYSSG